MSDVVVTEKDMEAARKLYLTHFHDGQWDGGLTHVARAIAAARVEGVDEGLRRAMSATVQYCAGPCEHEFCYGVRHQRDAIAQRRGMP